MSANHVALITHVKEHLLKQGVKSFKQDGGPRCLYRCETDEGVVLKCAIGALMPNSRYRTAMEDVPVDDLVDAYPEAFKSILAKFKLDLDEQGVTRALLESLQDVHDWYDVPEWEMELDALAAEYLTK